MKVRGREIKFLRTVKATADIAKLCPDGNIERIEELFNGDLSTTLETGAKLISYLNEGYEMNRHLDDPSYEPNVLTVEEIMYLDDKTFTELMQSAMKGMSEGTEQLVEIESKKGKKNNLKSS